MSVDYVAKLCDRYLKDLVRDIVEQFPDYSTDNLELELEHMRDILEEKKVGFLFERILKMQAYFRCSQNQKKDSTETRRRDETVFRVAGDFSVARERNKDDRDIVWFMQGSGAKYPNQKHRQEKDDKSYNQFKDLLEQLNFSRRGDQLFYNRQKQCQWFNALEDNGKTIYSQVYSGEEERFSNALRNSNLQAMHGKLRELLESYKESQNPKSTSETVAQDMITVAKNLSDLIPIIDENSKLKNKEQLQEERIEVQCAVFKKFFMRKGHKRKLESESLKFLLIKYYEEHALVETLVEEMCDIEKVSDEQIFVMTAEYLDLLWQDMEELREMAKHYNLNRLIWKLENKCLSNSIS